MGQIRDDLLIHFFLSFFLSFFSSSLCCCGGDDEDVGVQNLKLFCLLLFLVSFLPSLFAEVFVKECVCVKDEAVTNHMIVFGFQ